jgi:pantoate--beta-alanine ligase
MKDFIRISEVRNALKKERDSGKRVGFIPTMGALHDGHLSLIARSKAENDITICSIFVNPIQFNNKSDLENYPRNIREDLEMLEKSGCDAVFAPDEEEIYPRGTNETLDINFGLLERVLEGKYRPGHFQGVAIVVKKLFEIIEPHNAYFGEKDFQQLLIIRHMVSLLQLPVEIVACPIIREKDGLAMSSRNIRLTIGERQLAPFIYDVLCRMKNKGGTISPKDLQKWGIKQFIPHPEFRVEYIDITDKESLVPLDTWKNRKNAMVLAAVYLGDIRLIDNIELFL